MNKFNNMNKITAICHCLRIIKKLWRNIKKLVHRRNLCYSNTNTDALHNLILPCNFKGSSYVKFIF